ncbi:right-handed parallel beta-helix repeat-containing protein, partial [bacterium]|nr:right-handed parallel beta-helix repeat-containing protein [bacterium]
EFESRGDPMRASLAWAVVGIALSIPGGAWAATHHVPADYATIQGALDVSALGDTVFVAPGTYSDYGVHSDGAYAAWMPDGVVLQSEMGPSQTVIDLAPFEGVTYWSVAFAAGGHTSGQTVIDGFHVIGFPPNSIGASVGSCSAQVEIRNCIFEAPDPPDPAIDREGMSHRDSDVRVVNCTFIRCSASDGAGISHLGLPLVVEGCTFIECVNQGIRCQGLSAPNTLEVRDSYFLRCSSGPSVTGGSIAASQIPIVVVDRCVFEDPGADLTVGAAMALGGNGPKTVSNNVIRGMGLADGSSAVYLGGGSGTVTGNTFVDLHQMGNVGVALYTAPMPFGVVVSNNIVAHTSGADVFRFGSTYTLECNVFWDNAGALGVPLGPTDRVADPQFCDPDNGDYTLQGTSPCLPALSLGCDLIGALEQGCGTVSLTPESWGRIKSGFRNGEE